MRWKKFFWIITILLIATLSKAEYFRYVDQNGVVSYTDDLSKVPQSQRKELESFFSIEKTVDEPGDLTDGGQKPGGGQKGEVAKEIIKRDDTPALNGAPPAVEKIYSKELKDLKEKLDQEFTQLNEARAALLVDQQKIGNQKDVYRFNDKARRLNDRIKSFELRKEEYLKKNAKSSGVQKQ